MRSPNTSLLLIAAVLAACEPATTPVTDSGQQPPADAGTTAADAATQDASSSDASRADIASAPDQHSPDQQGADSALPDVQPLPDFSCQGKADGDWCADSTLVRCSSDVEINRIVCPHGCRVQQPAASDYCDHEPVCIANSSTVTPDPPVVTCSYMDWEMSSDGYYLNSIFGTDADPNSNTSCKWLKDHYNYYECQYDSASGNCVDFEQQIPWVQSHVDYSREGMIADIDPYMDGDVPFPEYFYIAGAQRFNCGSLLRVSNPSNGRCVVVYVEDGGPGSLYEGADYGARRIIDASPAMFHYLQLIHTGWALSDEVYVEWSLPGDFPGKSCDVCESTPAAAGYPRRGTSFDVQHMFEDGCRAEHCGDGVCNNDETPWSCHADCRQCAYVIDAQQVIDQRSGCFDHHGEGLYWYTEAVGYGGSILWTHTTDSADPNNYGIWNLRFASAGSYLVEAYTDTSMAQSALAIYQVNHDGVTDTVIVDQGAHNGWNPIGTFTFAAGDGQWLRLHDNTGEPYSGRVQIVFDAIRLTRQ